MTLRVLAVLFAVLAFAINVYAQDAPADDPPAPEVSAENAATESAPATESAQAEAAGEAATQPDVDEVESLLPDATDVQETTENSSDTQQNNQSIQGEKLPVSYACYQRCDESCACNRQLGGGGPFFMVLFNSYDTNYGDFDGPSFFFGGRGYSYFGDNHEWRVGGMGAGGFGFTESRTEINSTLFPASTQRSVGGGYGGLTAEYIFHAGGVEFPIGLLLGGGGGGFSSELLQKNISVHNVKTVYSKSTGFLALQPMVGIETNITDFVKASVAVSYLLAEPFGGERFFSGFALMFGVSFGLFADQELTLGYDNPAEETTVENVPPQPAPEEKASEPVSEPPAAPDEVEAPEPQAPADPAPPEPPAKPEPAAESTAEAV